MYGICAPPQERGWATGLMAGDSEYYDYTIVTVEISLTPAGLKVPSPHG
jgi:secreted Zn-dependent insulinase-like peptidase